MSRNERQHTLDRAAVSVLRQACGRLVPVDVIVAQVMVRADWIEPTKAEVEEAIRYVESQGRALGVSGETGRKYKLTEAGEAWALEVKL